jgi:hypothetical protein
VRRALLVLALAAALPAGAAETTMPPKGVWLIDVSYVQSTIDKAWDGDRQPQSLIDPIPRYEPGAGLQGTLSARPVATYQIALFQLAYGLFDWLTLAVNVPLVLRTTIDANFQWMPGDYQSSIGRRYSLDDFWAWAASLGQPRPADHWVGNQGTLADILIGARVLIPQPKVMRPLGLRIAGSLQVALPTGTEPDPEELISAGTTTWDLHAYGDVEMHLALDRPFLVEPSGVARVNIGADVFYSYFRPRTYQTPTGSRNPLILTYAPYVGSTYTIDPGDWFGATLSFDLAMIEGPTLNTWLSRRAGSTYGWPPLVNLGVGYTYIATQQTTWQSNSAQWDWDREKHWLPGDKNLVRVIATLSFLRLGLPLQIYGGYRAQDWIPGRYTRAADLFTVGARVVLKAW